MVHCGLGDSSIFTVVILPSIFFTEKVKCNVEHIQDCFHSSSGTISSRFEVKDFSNSSNFIDLELTMI